MAEETIITSTLVMFLGSILVTTFLQLAHKAKTSVVVKLLLVSIIVMHSLVWYTSHSLVVSMLVRLIKRPLPSHHLLVLPHNQENRYSHSRQVAAVETVMVLIYLVLRNSPTLQSEEQVHSPMVLTY